MMVIMTGVTPSSAGVLTLSDFSSDPGTVPAEWLDAQMSFSVASDVLTLDVTNNTGTPFTFRMNRLYFNTSPIVTGLVWWGAATPGWTLDVSEDAHHVANFGLFDVSLTDGVGTDPNQIFAGETETFQFQILGTGPFADTDFMTELSVPIGGGHIPSLAAAKFVGGGPDDLSAFGDVVPEPCTLSLLILGALARVLRKVRG
jgi:hypothetical protein